MKLSQVSNEVHAISQVFTGGVYDTLADIFAFEKNRQAETKNPARVLREVASRLCGVLLGAIDGSRRAQAGSVPPARVERGRPYAIGLWGSVPSVPGVLGAAGVRGGEVTWR